MQNKLSKSILFMYLLFPFLDNLLSEDLEAVYNK